MTDHDKKQFAAYLADVLAFYRESVSQFAINAWWEILKRFEFADVQRGINAHMADPDKGCFAPKPADIVRQLEGTRTDAAALAWAKVDRALRHHGVYPSLVFDDPLIHVVVQDLGGWISFAEITDEDWVFVGHRFQKAYQAYRATRTAPAHPPFLAGMSVQQNAMLGRPSQPPLMIGNAAKCQEVFKLGCDAPRDRPQPLPLDAVKASLQLVHDNTARKAG
jgi:hypothetical protein